MVEISEERDSLTGAHTFRMFQKRMISAFSVVQESGTLYLLKINVFHFRIRVNDQFGYDAGDAALREIYSIIEGAIRPDDYCARVSGDEFAVLFVNEDSNDLRVLAEGIRKTVEARYKDYFGLTLSLGIASYPATAKTQDMLIWKADEACFAASSRGGNCIIESRETSAE